MCPLRSSSVVCVFSPPVAELPGAFEFRCSIHVVLFLLLLLRIFFPEAGILDSTAAVANIYHDNNDHSLVMAELQYPRSL